MPRASRSRSIFAEPEFDLIQPGDGAYASGVVAKVREPETRHGATVGGLASLHPLIRLASEVIENRVMVTRRLLRQSVTHSRTMLQRVIAGRIRFTPRRNPVSGELDEYNFAAPNRSLILRVPSLRGWWPGTLSITKILGGKPGVADRGRLLE